MSDPAPQQSTDIHAKALAINLEASFYGTFADHAVAETGASSLLSSLNQIWKRKKKNKKRVARIALPCPLQHQTH